MNDVRITQQNAKNEKGKKIPFQNSYSFVHEVLVQISYIQNIIDRKRRKSGANERGIDRSNNLSILKRPGIK